MKRTEIRLNPDDYPERFRRLLDGATVYDSSCSNEARVIFIDKDCGYYLKSSKKGSLEKEAKLDAFFASKGLGANVVEYFSGDKDWLLTERVHGEDCTHIEYLSDPERLCDTIAKLLRELHELDHSGCPIIHSDGYFETVEKNFKSGMFDREFFDGSADEAFRLVRENKHLFKSDTLLHGDYCLPNIMLDNWCFSGFIDLGNGGVGDRHVDIFWGAWTLNFNLKTDKYRERFLDAYGRDKIEAEMLRVIAAAEAFG